MNNTMDKRPLSALMKVNADRQAGRLWKARDRLQGLLVTYPGDQEVLDLLGQVYFDMGDLPQAGRYWFLTERTGSEVDAVYEALVERFGGDYSSLGRVLPVGRGMDSLPPAVKVRLNPFLPYLNLPSVRQKRFGPSSSSKTFLGQMGIALMVVVVVFVFVGGWMAGVGFALSEVPGLAVTAIGGAALGTLFLFIDFQITKYRDARARRKAL